MRYQQSYEEVIEAMESAASILVATHRKPDGDAVGSLLGLCHVLAGIGKGAAPYCPEGIPRALRFLPGSDCVHLRGPSGAFDVTVLLDTPETALFPVGFPDAARRGTFVVIDHHARFEPFGDITLRERASAVGEMIYRLAARAGWPIGEAAATCLYTSIVSDTSSFRYESATPDSHLAAADLLTKGADPSLVASNLFESASASRQRLLAAVLNTLTVGLNGRFAALSCTQEMLDRAGAAESETSGLVNFARATEGVDIAVFMWEQSDGNVRVSIRSKGEVSASSLAERLGGGGHKNAGGCTLRDIPLDAAVERVEREAAQLLS